MKNLALCALLEATKMNPVKVYAKLAPRAHGLLRKDPNLKLIVSLFAGTELTVLAVWYLALNAPRTAILENHHLMVSKNVSVVLMICSPSNQVIYLIVSIALLGTTKTSFVR